MVGLQHERHGQPVPFHQGGITPHAQQGHDIGIPHPRTDEVAHGQLVVEHLQARIAIEQDAVQDVLVERDRRIQPRRRPMNPGMAPNQRGVDQPGPDHRGTAQPP